MFNISSSGVPVPLPGREAGDVEVPFQMWKNIFVRYLPPHSPSLTRVGQSGVVVGSCLMFGHEH